MAAEHLTEAERAARVPGIEFVTGADGTRRAKPTGTGLEVWQIVRYWLGVDRCDDVVLESFPYLERWQLDAALHYYALYPEEIDAIIEEGDRFNAWLADNAPVLFTRDGPIRYQDK